MIATENFLLAEDVLLIPVEKLPKKVLRSMDWQAGDVALTRPQSRTPSKVVDGQTAALLSRFQSPTELLDAVIEHSVDHQLDAETTLEEVYPAFENLIQAGFLVVEGSQTGASISPSLEPGSRVADYEVVEALQVLEDSEVYRLVGPDRQPAVLKLLREVRRSTRKRLAREAAILDHLDGTISPRLLARGEHDDKPFLVVEWRSGSPVDKAAHRLRLRGQWQELDELCLAVAGAYARLHDQQVLHSDVHPRNVLFDPGAGVTLLDFDYARVLERGHAFEKAPRGGIASFFDPQYAAAALEKKRPALSSPASEQFSVATLIYGLLTGADPVDYSIEREAIYRQIVEQPPMPLNERGYEACAALEDIFTTALAKSPDRRFPSMHALAGALTEAFAHQQRRRAELRQGARAKRRDFIDDLIFDLAPDGALFASGLPEAPFASVKFGSAGVAHGLYRLALARDCPRLLSWSRIWLSRAYREASAEQALDDPAAGNPAVHNPAFHNPEQGISLEVTGAISPYHSATGLHLTQALICRAGYDPMGWQAAVQTFVHESDSPCTNPDLTLGRTGSLLAHALLREAYTGPFCAPPELSDQARRLVHDLWHEAEASPPIGTRGGFMDHLGLAHGWAGLIYATLRWCRCSGDPWPAGLERRIAELADLAEPHDDGLRWRFEARRFGRRAKSEDFYVGWCNGAAGFTFLWNLVQEMSADSPCGHRHFEALATGAGLSACRWHPSALSLCCGAAGQGYALLDLYRRTGDRAWLRRAQNLVDRTLPRSPARGEAEYHFSLYKGVLGLAVLLADLEAPEEACMPMFGDELWTIG